MEKSKRGLIDDLASSARKFKESVDDMGGEVAYIERELQSLGLDFEWRSGRLKYTWKEDDRGSVRYDHYLKWGKCPHSGKFRILYTADLRRRPHLGFSMGEWTDPIPYLELPVEMRLYMRAVLPGFLKNLDKSIQRKSMKLKMNRNNPQIKAQ